MSAHQPLRLLAYTDSHAVGGAELALGYLLGALHPALTVGVLATSAAVAEMLAAQRLGMRVSVLPAPHGTHDRRALLAHLRAIRAHRPDVLHANQSWPWACGYAELAALALPGVRVVAVDHLPLAAPVPRARLLARRLLARRLDAHVSVGERSARQVERIVGLPHGSVGSVPNGVPVAEPVARAGPASVTRRPPTIGSVGRLSEQKGYDLLVRALPDLPEARLVLVGDGPSRGELEELAARLGVRDRLCVTGWSADPRAHLADFDVFALPSRWEGMPLGILEAMHAGLPVVASDVGSVAESVRDGDTGRLVAAGDLAGLVDALRALLGDAQRRRRMGERGRALALAEFTDVVMARRYEALYRALSAGAPPQAAGDG